MKRIARLAISEFDKSTDISVRRSIGLPGSTLHGHDFYELDIITGSACASQVNGKECTAERGFVFFMTPEDFHEYAYEDGIDLYNIQFTREAIPPETLSRISEAEERIFFLDDARFSRVLTLTETMHGLSLRKSPDAAIASKLLECILLTVASDCESLPQRREGTDTITEAISFIHSHFKENPSLTSVAKALSLNENYFCKRFKEYTGQTYKEYLRAVKLRYARRLLMATELPAIEVAERCGYSTQSHFNREFKEYYGKSPLKMRQNSEAL